MKKRLILAALTMFAATVSSWAFTAQFHAGAGTIDGLNDFPLSEENDGAGIVLPTPVLSACDNWEFAGWIASSTAYEPHDELTQDIYPAGTLYHLSSVSEEFYAVYRYITDRYCEIYVNDQLITGAQYIVVNQYRRGFMYPSADGLYAHFIESYYNTWNNGYINIDAPISSLEPDIRARLPHVLSETNEVNQYWALYNPHTELYVDFENVTSSATCNSYTDCIISKTGWNTFSFEGAMSHLLIGLDEDRFYSDFYIYRQQTFFASHPDCSAANYTVTFDAGTNGTAAVSSLTETGFRHGVVLPAATPNTGGNDCNALWEFAGWAEDEEQLNVDVSRLPERLWLQGAVYYPSGDVTLHAVYRRKSTIWEQVEDAEVLNSLQAGEKVLIAYDTGDGYYVLSAEEQAAGHNASVAVGAMEIESLDNAALVWTLEGKKGAWRLKDANGKHLDMTREDYAYSYTYPWSRWSDEFTIAGDGDFTIRSNYAGRNYLTADATKFASQSEAQTSIHIFRQVTTYSHSPKCDAFTILFNSGEGTFGSSAQKNATVAITDVSSLTGIALNDASIPVAVAPDCERWKFSGWRVGSGLNATTNGPGILYTSSETFIPMKDSVTLYAVYQNGDGRLYYEKVNSRSEITTDGTYAVVNTNNKAVTYNNNTERWSGTNVTITNDTITGSSVSASMQWYYDGTMFYQQHGTTYYLADENNKDYPGEIKTDTPPFKLQYVYDPWYWSEITYYLRWNNSSRFEFETTNSNNEFNIFKQKTTVDEYNSWPHCTPFSVVLNACGGTFPGGSDTRTLTEDVAGDGMSLAGNTPTNDCGWTLVGWMRAKPLQATSVNPSSRLIAPSSTQYNPHEDNEQLYAVYYDGTSIWSSYPSCGGSIDIVKWTADGVIVETYTPCAGVPTINGVAGTPNGDGTYTLPFDVASNPCVPVHIQWGTASQIEKTPILVNFYSRLSAYVNAFGDCTNCDVVVAEGGSAIVNKTDQSVRNLTVYPGGRFIIEAGKTFNASSLTMRAEGDQLMPSASILGTFNCPVLYHDRRIDNTRYYWIALPYDVQIADITYADDEANGKQAVYDTDFYIQYYNGLRRAADKGTSRTYWEHIGDITDESYQTRTTLKAGRGYLLGLPRNAQSSTGHTSRTLRFPMSVDSWDTETNVLKTVAVAGSDCDKPQHIGWNLIGNPFLQNYSAVTSEDLICGRIVEYYDEVSGEWVEPWYVVEEGTESVPYITTYDPSTDSYTQTRLLGQNIPPFSTAFIQLPDGKTGLQFNGTAMRSTNAPARRMGLLNEDNSTSEFSIVAYAVGDDDSFTVILDNNRSTGYEIGADLMKMRSSGKTNIYAHHNAIECAFDAIGYSDADSIPVGLTMPVAGELLIKAERKRLSDDVEHIWLVDNLLMTRTDLLSSAYTLTAEAGTFNNRLWIQVEMQSDVVTELDNTYSIGLQPQKMLVNGQLIIQCDRQIYNATGIRIR